MCVAKILLERWFQVTFQFPHLHPPPTPQRSKQMDFRAYFEMPVLVHQTAGRYISEDSNFKSGLRRTGCSEVSSEGLTIEYADARA